MPVLQFQTFAGMIPMKDDTSVPDGNAAYCENAYLYGGSLRGFGAANPVYTLKNGGTQAVYRIPNSVAAKPNFPASLWLEFADPFISVLRAPMVEDQYSRYYFFPSTGTPYYNTLANLTTGVGGYILGIPTPEVAPTVSYTGGTAATQEVRSYVYTWVSYYGEEGAPGPATTLQGTVDGTWTIGMTAPTITDYQGRNLAFLRIYRTVTDTNGNAAFYQVAQLPISSTTYSDSALDAAITANLALQTSAIDPVSGSTVVWTPPPSDLQGVVQMANGMMAGWSNTKEIWFCQPYVPHAWPAAYALTVDAVIVGLAAVGASLIVLTEGSPWIFSGVTPGGVTGGKITTKDPCISRGSIVAAGEGVYYASPNGLILVNSMGTTNMTQSFISKEAWIAMDPYDFAATRYSMAYAGFIKGTANVDNGLVLDHVVPNVSFTWLALAGPIVNVYFDEASADTFYIANGAVYQWNPEVPTALTSFRWKSKRFRLPYETAFVGGKIYFDVPATLSIPTPTSATRNVSQTQSYNAASQYLLLKVYADGNLVYVREVQVSGEEMLFPAGFKATYWQFELAGQVNVNEMKFATSIKELREA